MKKRTEHLSISRYRKKSVGKIDDVVAIEEPLEIRIGYSKNKIRKEQAISITMRTPGHDAQLALGFLYSEGLIPIESIAYYVKNPTYHREVKDNVILIEVSDRVTIDLSRHKRNFYTTSSCGVCGKGSIEALEFLAPPQISKSRFTWSEDQISHLHKSLFDKQSLFQLTGGIHAAALYGERLDLIHTFEDVGRHNAMDKLIGWSIVNDLLLLDNHIILLSGRASFELVQKAAMAGCRGIISVGAPSSLAVELSKSMGLILIGFLKEDQFNVYSGLEQMQFV